MPDINKTRELLESRFQINWGSTTPISYDNVPFDDTAVNEFVSITFLNFATMNATIGGAINKCKKHEGAIQIKVHIKLDTGTGDAYEYADSIAAIMENYQDTNLFTHAAEVRRIGALDSGWFVILVHVPFISYEV